MAGFLIPKRVWQGRCRQKRENEALNAWGVKKAEIGGFTRERHTKKVHRIRARAQQIHFATPPVREADFCWAENAKGMFAAHPEIGLKP